MITCKSTDTSILLGRLSHGPPGLARGHLAPSRQVADSQVVPDSREQRLAAGHLPVSQQLGEHVMCRQCSLGERRVTSSLKAGVETQLNILPSWITLTHPGLFSTSPSPHLKTEGPIMSRWNTHTSLLEVILSRLSSPVLATSSRLICLLTPTSFESHHIWQRQGV